MKRILLVDDDQDVRESLLDIIESGGYQVVSAENGLDGLEKYKSEKGNFNLVISDIRMPKMDGVKFFESLAEIKSADLPFIMMTGFSEFMDAQKAHQMGVDEFITKPFTREELLGVIEVVLQSGEERKNKKIEDSFGYCGVSIDDFLMGSKVQCDVFLRLSPEKYLLIARSNAPLSKERLDVFKKRGLEKLYIRDADFANFVGFNLKLAKAAASANIPMQTKQKINVLKNASQVYLSNAFVQGVDKEAYASGKELMLSTVSVVSQSNDMLSLLEMLQGHNEIVYAHSLAVGVYCSLIAKSIGWTSPQSLFKISMAGLFHDIGKKELPAELLNKARPEMTAEEVKLYESHPVRGQKILSQIDGVPEEVIQTALQHHENMLGSGFPHGLSAIKLQPLSMLIGLGNLFCEFVLRKDSEGNLTKAHDALDYIHKFHQDDYDPVFLKALMGIFNFPVPADLERKVRVVKSIV